MLISIAFMLLSHTEFCFEFFINVCFGHGFLFCLVTSFV